ncbi:MAG: helix-turn-helix transcriptional regulator [bacterium]|nr:helix-turn-helix transcriptional regulator [bacterium]
MKNGDHRLLLERAARASLERIRRDGEKAPEKIGELFPYLEQHLFERALDVNRMRRDCGKRDNSVSSFFADVTGLGPHAYIVARRLETAAVLLRDTDLQVRIISKLVGFSKPGLLTQHFKACHVMTPRDFRLRAKRNIPVGASPTPARSQTPQKPFTFEIFSLAGEDLERIKVEGLWEELREKPWAEQRDMIRHRLAFSTPVFFHFLRKKSIPEGRDNRKYGVHLAELALECLRVTEQVIGKELFDLRAQGWAWAGNARRLADELSRAEAAFSIAATYLDLGEEESLVHAEFYGLKSTLRLWQGRLDESTTLHGRALRIFRTAGTERDIAASLIEGAYTYGRAGKDKESIAYSREALQLLGRQAEPYLEFAASYNLSTAYVKSGAPEKAKEILPRLCDLREAAHAGRASLHFLQWLEGRVMDELGDFASAAGRYQTAREGFLKLNQNVHGALVSLDFALHCWKQAKPAQVRELTLGIIPLLEAIQFHEEAAAGLKLLQSAIEKDALTQKLLQDVRDHLEGIRPGALDLKLAER